MLLWLPSGIPVPSREGCDNPSLEGKGDQWDYSNYCGITVLNIPSKDIAQILLRRFHDHVLSHQNWSNLDSLPASLQ